jgi:hypothetical protein
VAAISLGGSGDEPRSRFNANQLRTALFAPPPA